jgi:hypothetical protein
MRPRPLAVALGVLICLAMCLVTTAQRPLLSLALEYGVNYLFVPLLAVSLWTYCLGIAAQTILNAHKERTRIRTDVYLLYHID